jgi:hypothetical protein
MATKTPAPTRRAAVTTRPPVVIAKPRGTLAPSSLGAMAITVARDPVFKWFGSIEDRMDTAEESTERAREQAVAARIAMLRSKAAMMVATTISSDVYATAVLRDASADDKAKQFARSVVAWRDVLEVALAESKRAQELEDVERAVRKVSLAKWSMLEDALEMMTAAVDGPGPRKPPPAVPTPVALQPCPTGHPKLQPGRGTPRQRKMLAYLATKGLEFVAHMHSTRASDVLTRNLLTWNRNIEAYSVLAEVTTGSHAVTIGSRGESRCIAVAYDSFSSLPRMLTRLLHELAHVANPDADAHGPGFYRVFRTFLRVASEEMGWVLEATCRETCFPTEKGYTPQTACPRCVWQTSPEQCKMTAADCEPSQIGRDELAKMFAKDPTVLAFLNA